MKVGDYVRHPLVKGSLGIIEKVYERGPWTSQVDVRWLNSMGLAFSRYHRTSLRLLTPEEAALYTLCH